MTAMTSGDRRPVCSLCLVNRTTATLGDGSPICWRPCYAALTRVQAGYEARAAVLQAFEDVPDGMRLARQMVEAGFNIDALCSALVLEASLRNIGHMGGVAGMLADTGRLALPEGGRA